MILGLVQGKGSDFVPEIITDVPGWLIRRNGSANHIAGALSRIVRECNFPRLPTTNVN